MISMKGLAVLHTEDNYLDETGRECFNSKLFEKIGVEIGRRIETGDSVYYLPGGCNIYPSVNKFAPQMRVISDYRGSSGWAERQFLKTKEIVMSDNLEEIAIAGVAYDCCVRDLHLLFRGLEGSEISMREYRNAAKKLEWTPEKFDQVFGAKLNVRVIEELTDKELFDALNP